MQLMKIRAAAVFLAAALFLCPNSAARVNALGLSAQSAVLMDAASGRVLYAKSEDDRSLIASTTKIMTALVVCEQCNVLDRVEIPKEATGIEGSSMYLVPGEVMTVQDLLYGLMLHSGNDAAVALAIYCGGTVEGFVELMNEEASRLSLSGTHFQNPNGLDAPEHYSTAHDLAVLTAYAMENPIFAQTVSTKSVQAAGRALTNHNKLLWRYDGAEGVKTGYTKAAGRILVSSAKRDGRRLIAVTINAPDDWNDHARMLDYGFSQFTETTLAEVGDLLLTVPALTGEQVTVLAGEDFSYPLAEGEQVTFLIPAPGFLYTAPRRGESAGYVLAQVNGKTVARLKAIYGETQ